MRGYYVIIVAALTVVAIGESASQIPRKASVRKNKCPSSGTVRLPHPKDCTLYYNCQDGKNVLNECPDGLHFNKVTQQCDWPSARCVLEPDTQPIKRESNEDIEDRSGCIGTCPIPDPMDRTIHLPYSGDCTKFCKCSNGTPFLMECPDGLHWDIAESACNWAWEAKCRQ